MKSQINKKVIIRPVKPEDKDDIVKIQYDALKIIAAKDYRPKQLNALLKSKSVPRKSPETIFMAEISGQPVGFASLLDPPNTIGAVFVHPNFARRSVGTLLLKRIEQEAIANRISVLWVHSSLTGHAFYKANGYQTIREICIPLYSTYIPCMLMKKRLLPIDKQEIIMELSQFTIALSIVIMLISFCF